MEDKKEIEINDLDDDTTLEERIISNSELEKLYADLDKLPLIKLMHFRNELANQISLYKSSRDTIISMKDINDALAAGNEVSAAKKIQSANEEEELKAKGIEDFDKFLEDFDKDIARIESIQKEVDIMLKKFGESDMYAKASFLTNQMIISTNYDITNMNPENLNYGYYKNRLDIRLDALENRLNHDFIIRKMETFFRHKDTKKAYKNYERYGKKALENIHKALKGNNAKYAFSKVLVDVLNRFGYQTSRIFVIFIDRMLISEKRTGNAIFIKILLMNLISIYNMKHPEDAIEPSDFDITDDLEGYEKYVDDNIFTPLKNYADNL